MKTSSDRLRTKQTYQLDEDSPRDTRPGKASKHYPRFSWLLRQAVKDGRQELFVVIYCRVSSDKQRRYGNIIHQLAKVKRRLNRLGKKYGIEIEVIEEFLEEDVSASLLWKGARPEFVKAAKLAEERDAVVVTLNTSRFVRNKRNWRDTPRVFEFEDLMSLVGKAQISTLHHPDENTDQGEGKSADIIRGLAAAKKGGVKLGPPKMTQPQDKKRRRWQFKLPVIQLCKQGLGNREIARKLELPEKTVRDWRKRYSKYLGASFLGKQRQEVGVSHSKTSSIRQTG